MIICAVCTANCWFTVDGGWLHVLVVCAYITTLVKYCHGWLIRSDSVYRCVTTAHRHCIALVFSLHSTHMLLEQGGQPCSILN